MSALRTLVRSGSYFDSIVLLRLQSGLKQLPGVEDAGAVMATPVNLEILAANDLLVDEAATSRPDDLLVVVRAADEQSADAALERVDDLLRQRRADADTGEYRPKAIATAVSMLPESRWVLISVPGAWAGRVAAEALELGRNVMLYSDNVPIEDEARLKRRASGAGLVVMGPDCGTAQIGGIGLGFANRTQHGAVGLVAASGTGLQAVTCRLHELGTGVSHALGTGGRDLSVEIGAATTLQCLDLLARDPETSTIVVVSKPPAPEVTSRVLAAARSTGKPVVIYFIGHPPPGRRAGTLCFASSLTDAAELAAELASGLASRPGPADATRPSEVAASLPGDADSGYLRGLFSGGTLAFEALKDLAADLSPIYSNLALPGVEAVDDPARSQGHTLLDLGADEFTVGRLHPMMDPDLRLRRLRREGLDLEVGAILLDVVLGDSSHSDPSEGLVPTLTEIRRNRDVAVAVILLGTDLDPQGLDGQRERLESTGARVFTETGAAVDWLRSSGRLTLSASTSAPVEVPLSALESPPAVINIGLEVFYDSLLAQGARAVQMDWRPPAGGDKRLLALLERTK